MANDGGINGTHLLIAFFAGAVTGATVALLTTPQTGAQTREQLGKVAKTTQQRVSEQIKQRRAVVSSGNAESDKTSA